jgi:PAS domain S-box-containing protein/putative nucleotidyltransferase with HDIG domain
MIALKELTDSIGDVFYIIDMKARLIYVSGNTENMYGYSAGEMLTLSFQEIDIYNADRFQRNCENATIGKSYSIETLHRRKDGTLFPVRLNLTLIEKGSERLLVGLASDLSARKNGEVEPVNRQKGFQTVHDTNGGYLFTADEMKSKGSEAEVAKIPRTFPEFEGDLEPPELEGLIDFRSIQSLMDDFYKLTKITVSIIDNHGKSLVATGGCSIYSTLHCTDPEIRHKREIDYLEIAGNIEAGSFKMYKCANNIWRVLMPIFAGEKRLGSICFGQFFMENEEIDYEFFSRWAKERGFDEKKCLEAIESLPRLKIETVDTIISFYSKFAKLIADRSLSNMELARATVQRDMLNKTVIDNEKRYALFVEHTDDLIIMINFDGILAYVSPAGERLFGYTMENLIGHPYGEFIHPDDLEMAKDALDKTFNEGSNHTTTTLEFRVRYADGSWKWLSINGYITQDCEECPSYFIGIARDITGRKNTEEALRRSEEEKSLILNATKETIVYYNRDLRINWINRAMAKRLGMDVADLIGKKCFEIWKAGEKCNNCILERVIKSREQKKEELTNEMGEFWLLRAYPVIGPDGEVSGIVEISEDITERKRASKKLEAAFDALISTASDIVSARDPYTADHQRNVSKLALAIGREMRLEDDICESIRVAGLLHDIGKITVPTELLTRLGKLNEIEFDLIKEHSRSGYEILKDVDLPWPVAEIVLQHHERLDGSGYPDGLKGDEIRLESKIIAVADVVETITSHRPYRSALGIDAALNEIVNNSGKLYDPQIVKACLTLFKRGYTFEYELGLQTTRQR